MKNIIAVILTVLFLNGCASQPKSDENVSELLTPSEVPVEQEKVETQEPEKGFGYYATVVVGTVLYTGVVILNEIVAHHH